MSAAAEQHAAHECAQYPQDCLPVCLVAEFEICLRLALLVPGVPAVEAGTRAWLLDDSEGGEIFKVKGWRGLKGEAARRDGGVLEGAVKKKNAGLADEASHLRVVDVLVDHDALQHAAVFDLTAGYFLDFCVAFHVDIGASVLRGVEAREMEKV